MLGAFGEIPTPQDFRTIPELRDAIHELVSASTGDNPAAIGPWSAGFGAAPTLFGGDPSDEYMQAAGIAGGMIAQPYIDAAAQTVDPFLEQLGAGLTPTPVPAHMPVPGAGHFGIPPTATFPVPGGQTIPLGTPPLFQGMPSLSDIGNMLVPQPAADVFTGMMNMPPQPPPPPAMPTNIPPQPPAPPFPTTISPGNMMQNMPQHLPPPAPPLPTYIPPMGPYQGVGGYPVSPGY